MEQGEIAMSAGVDRVVEVGGLALYDRGQGEPVLLMPYSHAFTTSPMAEGHLAELLLSLGRRVLSFDPPGAYRSSRSPRMDVSEMVDCASETLEAFDIKAPVDIVGHSTGAFCATQFSRLHPQRVRRLVLLSPTGVGDTSKLKALPFGMTDSRFWRFYRLALPVYGGRGTASQHKDVYDLLVPALHATPSTCPAYVVDADDADKPAPARAAMLRGIPRLDHDALQAIHAPTLIVVGGADPIVPLPLARRVAGAMLAGELVVLDSCGHYPQHEVPSDLEAAIRGFLA